jgi:thiol-disulfide isomerase/thioredoxin
MTNGTQPRRRGPIFLGLAAVALLAGLAGIYVIGGPDGNRQAAASCSAATARAAAVAPLARGEVAAFLPATRGEPLPELAFLAPDGGKTTLADFRGRTVLLNLWATWCAPCRKEMPALDRLQAELGSDAFEVVAVSVDQGSPDKPKAFLDEIGVANLRFYSDPTMGIFQKIRAYGRAPGLPATLLIDGEGCEIGALMGPAEWDAPDAVALIRAALDAGS